MINGLPVDRLARYQWLIELMTGQRGNRINLVDGGHVELCRKLLLSSTRMPVTGQQDPSGRSLRHLLKIDWVLLKLI